jgi:hypothetical protein
MLPGIDYDGYDDYDYEDDDDDDNDDSRSPPAINVIRPRPVNTRGGAEISTGSLTLSAGSQYVAGAPGQDVATAAPLITQTIPATTQRIEAGIVLSLP